MQTKKIFGISVFIILATIIGVALAIFVFRQFSIYVPLENQAVDIDLQEPLQAKVKIHDTLDVDVTGTIDATIPIKETLNIDAQNTLPIKIKKSDLEIPLSSIRLNQYQDQPDERAL